MHPSLSWVRDPTLTPGHGLLPAAATGSCTGHLAKCSLGRTPRCPVLLPPPTPARGARRCLLADAGAPVFTRCLNRTRGEDLALPAPPLLDHSQHPRVSARAHTHMHAHEHTPRLLCKHFHGPEHSTAALAPLGLWASPGGGGRQPLGKPFTPPRGLLRGRAEGAPDPGHRTPTGSPGSLSLVALSTDPDSGPGGWYHSPGAPVRCRLGLKRYAGPQGPCLLPVTGAQWDERSGAASPG